MKAARALAAMLLYAASAACFGQTQDASSPATDAASARPFQIHFLTDHADLTPNGKAAVAEAAQTLSRSAGAKAMIAGYADERGSDSHNLALSERRARTVADALIQLGVSPARINASWYGEARPVCKSHDEACWAKNRRVDIAITPE